MTSLEGLHPIGIETNEAFRQKQVVFCDNSARNERGAELPGSARRGVSGEDLQAVSRALATPRIATVDQRLTLYDCRSGQKPA